MKQLGMKSSLVLCVRKRDFKFCVKTLVIRLKQKKRMMQENNSKKEMSDDQKSTQQVLRFRYRNWRGEVADRSVIPLRTSVASSRFHNGGKPCWIMTAIDVEKDEIREFKLSDIIQYYDLI
ncbi:hypothetical protein [Escherichia phage FS2B]|nr:hypothetical protein [Escherichia phage FS2B]